MNREDIKKVIGKLEPDEEMENRVSEKILQKQHNKFHLKYMLSIAASLVVVVSIGIVGRNYTNNEGKPPYTGSIENNSNINKHPIELKDGIYIPKIELPKDTDASAAMDMIGLIVYQGRIYTQTGTRISPENGEKLLGEKLGTTKGNIDEWSKQEEYAVEFASTIGEKDVYSVKGYDKDFRIMTYIEINGEVYTEFYECINGITVRTGEDLFGKLKIENNIKAAKYEKFESWNYNKQQYKELTNFEVLNSFVNELKNTIPYTQESLSNLWDDNGETKQKFIYVTLKDGSEVRLRLFKDGYVYYHHIFFKMDHEIFNMLWYELE